MTDDGDYRTRFIEFAIDRQVLRFGDFTLKSGRHSPYFFNAGHFDTGGALARLGGFYARAIQDTELEFDMLFGPAYKGIPLVAATAVALAEHFGQDLPYAFNRKEAKDHGEGGALVGAPMVGRVLIVDDVITAGTAIRESVELIRAHGAEPVGVAISLDRQERGRGERSAIQEVEQDLGLSVLSIATLADLIGYLGRRPDMGPQLEAMQAYRAQYGVA